MQALRALLLSPVLLAGIVTMPAFARAQQPSAFSLVARRAAAVQANPGATVTLVATASNRSGSDAQATPAITLPAGWQVVTGAAPFALAAGATETVITSIAVPAGTSAGTYSIGLSVEFAGASARASVRDSAIVTVREHRSIGLALVNKPGYAVAGGEYEASFLVFNRGNSPARVTLAARSSRGRARAAEAMDLEPGDSRELLVRVQLRDATGNPADDILEVAAVHAADSSVGGDATARIAIVPRAGRLDGYTTVSSMLRLRATPGNGGMSPFDFTGGGSLNADGSSHISFSANGRTRGTSRFGERENYRLELNTPRSRVRLGDNLYTLSQLTGSGQPGVGASVERTIGPLTAGAFGQRFRSAPHLGTELGAFASVQSGGSGRAKATLNVVDRSGGQFAGRVASSEISVRATDAIAINGEYATSGDGATAYNTRLSGRVGTAAIDVGHHRADAAFKGPQRGSSHDYLDVRAPITQGLRVGAFASRSSTTTPADSASSNAFANSGVSATIHDRFTVELSSLDRSIGPSRERQRAVRLRSDFSLGLLKLTGDAKIGISRDSATRATGMVRQFSLAPRLRMGRHSFAGHIGRSETARPQTAGGAADNVVTTAGLDVTTRLARATEVGISGFGTNMPGIGWSSQLDMRLSQALSAGIVMTARAHVVTTPGAAASVAQPSAFFLEFAVPMRVPVFPRGGYGRVHGRVSDAATGRPVRDALVRVGSRLAVTDRNGRVALHGVEPGEHRVTLGDDTTHSSSVLVGAMTIVVDSAKSAPARFTVAVARGAAVRTEIRRMARVRTALDSTAADSLVDDGPMGNLLVSLTSSRDTLYQTTDSKGAVSFTDVAPGDWVVAVVPADVPANHEFDRESYELSLEPGQVVTKGFVLLPRRRAVQMVAATDAPVVVPAVNASTAEQR